MGAWHCRHWGGRYRRLCRRFCRLCRRRFCRRFCRRGCRSLIRASSAAVISGAHMLHSGAQASNYVIPNRRVRPGVQVSSAQRGRDYSRQPSGSECRTVRHAGLVRRLWPGPRWVHPITSTENSCTLSHTPLRNAWKRSAPLPRVSIAPICR